jgi:hypothetical protein
MGRNVDRNAEKATKRQHSPEEIDNDPSLKYCGYRPFEAVYSDTHGGLIRFHRYVGSDRVELAEMNSMAVIAGTVPALSVRRP